MSVKATALTTGQRAADFIGLGTVTGSKLTLLERMVDSVTEFIEKYIGRSVQQATYTNEEYDTDNSDTLLLGNFPITTFTKLERRTSALNEDDWETIDSTYYHVDLKAGMIKGASGWTFGRTTKGYRVTYIAGFNYDNSATFLSDTDGGDLEMAAWLLVSSVYGRKKGGITSESLGDYRVSYASALFENDDIKGILDKYRKVEAIGPITPFHY